MTLPPLHPALVHYPIAFIILSVIAEYVGYYRGSPGARTVAWWALVSGLIGGVLTIWAGYFDMGRATLASETHDLVHQHLKIGLLAGGGLLVLTVWRGYSRSRVRHGTGGSAGGGYLCAATAVMLLIFFQAWYGGEMTYAHGAGVAPTGQGVEPVEKAKSHLTPVHEFLDTLPGMRGDHEE